MEKLTKSQLTEIIVAKTDLSKKQADEAVSCFLDAVIEALKEGKSIGLTGLGTLSVKDTAARTGVKPGTTERIQIPASKKVSFKASNTLKEAIKP